MVIVSVFNFADAGVYCLIYTHQESCRSYGLFSHSPVQSSPGQASLSPRPSLRLNRSQSLFTVRPKVISAIIKNASLHIRRMVVVAKLSHH